ncbi:MAG: bifunctional 4-hydroxy-2-oxoglutarate aldolase/2-dehydro-3-deoxy-phosphogluconate aldolase [Desulfobacteraceae bacterium]|nr:bifunctional 4-hydroxy-2-oxoglutarate aldolase/2-dehydro-3-deoxy-phosphogluconate aldolase [Desulfobacteraceae bacterium]
MNQIIKRLSEYKLLPVVTVKDPQTAVKLSHVLVEQGLPAIEITFRTDAAPESIRLVRKAFPGITIGAGTVLDIDQVKIAQNAGANFVVAPGFNPLVIDFCLENQITMIPGVDSPTLIEAALSKGLELVKFYPAQASGGIDYLKAIAGPYENIGFMPTGGINPDNLKDYLDYEKVMVCGASWLAPSSVLEANDFNTIEKRIALALSLR